MAPLLNAEFASDMNLLKIIFKCDGRGLLTIWVVGTKVHSINQKMHNIPTYPTCRLAHSGFYINIYVIYSNRQIRRHAVKHVNVTSCNILNSTVYACISRL